MFKISLTKNIFNSSAIVHDDGRKLIVEYADVSDTGNYRCVANNNVGIAEKKYSVKVRGRCCINLFLVLIMLKPKNLNFKGFV